MDSLIFYHSFLVYALVAVILINMLISYSSKEFNTTVKRTRIGYFFFWGVWAMVVFAGLVIFAFMKGQLSTSVIVMIIAATILPIIDAYRAIGLRKLWLKDDLGSNFSIKLLLLELIVVAITTVIALQL